VSTVSSEVREFKELLFILFHAFEEGEPERVPEHAKERLVELTDKLFSDPLYKMMARDIADMFETDRAMFYWKVAHLLFAVDGIGH
jgi:hypothetical protein